jgi:hypothetical protein
MSDLNLSYDYQALDYQGLGQMCGEGSHPVCQAQGGLGHHHYNRPDLDNGLYFACACGCHVHPLPVTRTPILVIGSDGTHTWR